MNPRPNHEHLSAWLDGELDEAEAAELEAELSRDPELRASLRSLESVVRVLRAEGPAQAPLGFDRRVMARIEEEHPERASWWSRLRRPGGVPLEGWVLGLAAAAALLLVLPIGGGTPGDPVPRDVSPAAVERPQVARPLTEVERDVIGRATTGTDSIPAGPGTAGKGRERTRAAESIVRPTSSVQMPPIGSLPPLVPPEGTADVAPAPTPEETAAPGGYRYVVRSEDAGMKREILALAGRYGSGALGTDSAPIVDSQMRSGTEELVVTLAHTDLTSFSRDLAARGYTIESTAPSDRLLGGTVEVRIVLQLVGGPNAGAPAVPNAARKSLQRESESVGEGL